MKLCKQHTSLGEEPGYLEKKGLKNEVECRNKNINSESWIIPTFKDANMLHSVNSSPHRWTWCIDFTH